MRIAGTIAEMAGIADSQPAPADEQGQAIELCAALLDLAASGVHLAQLRRAGKLTSAIARACEAMWDGLDDDMRALIWESTGDAEGVAA